MKRKLFFAVIATAFVFTGCGRKSEPVSAEPTEIIESTEEVETESEETDEKSEAEPILEEPVLAEPVKEESDIEESEDNNSELGYTIVLIDDTVMYCTANSANIRKGPNTEYEKVGTLSYAQEIVVNGKVETADSTWYVIKTDNSNDIQMVSGSLLSTTKPQPPQTSTPSGDTGNTGNTQPSSGGSGQPSGGGGQSSGGIVTDDGEPPMVDSGWTPAGGGFGTNSGWGGLN